MTGGSTPGAGPEPPNLGSVGLGTFQLDPRRFLDAAPLTATVRRAVAMGITLIDTAPIYGLGAAEELVGQVVREDHLRDRVVLLTKTGIEWDERGRFRRNARPEALLSGVKASLRRLGVDVIDICLVHWPDPSVPMGEVADCLESMRAAGLVRWTGLSNGTAALLDAWVEHAPLHCLEECYSLIDRGIEGDILPWAAAHDVPTVTYGVLARGLLADRPLPAAGFVPPDERAGDPLYAPEIIAAMEAARPGVRALARRHATTSLALALAWTLHRPHRIMPLVGAHHPEQLSAVADALHLRLIASELDQLEREVAPVLTLRSRVRPLAP